MEVLNLSMLVKRYKNNCALDSINLSVNKGEIVSIIGPSGSGKSTLLRCIKGLTRVTEGSINLYDKVLVSDGKYIQDAQFRKIQSSIGMVFQSFNLFSNMTALENIIYAPIHVNKVSKKEAIKEAYNLFNLMGLNGKADMYPIQLSGGEKQRVAIARSMAMKPELILFDEPTSALDPESTGDVLNAIKNLAKKNITMLIVTHEMSFAQEISDRIVFMDGGKILKEGCPEDMLNAPESDRIMKFLSV